MFFLGFWLCEAESKRDQKGETISDQKSIFLQVDIPAGETEIIHCKGESSLYNWSPV